MNELLDQKIIILQNDVLFNTKFIIDKTRQAIIHISNEKQTDVTKICLKEYIKNRNNLGNFIFSLFIGDVKRVELLKDFFQTFTAN